LVKAFIGIKIEAGEKSHGDWTGLTSIRDAIANLEEVTEVYLIYGRFDLMVVTDVENLEDINSLVWEKLRSIEGVQSTETFIVSY
jgi:DNA-binding Lrp family transcriptional regulator